MRACLREQMTRERKKRGKFPTSGPRAATQVRHSLFSFQFIASLAQEKLALSTKMANCPSQSSTPIHSRLEERKAGFAVAIKRSQGLAINANFSSPIANLPPPCLFLFECSCSPFLPSFLSSPLQAPFPCPRPSSTPVLNSSLTPRGFPAHEHKEFVDKSGDPPKDQCDDRREHSQVRRL